MHAHTISPHPKLIKVCPCVHQCESEILCTCKRQGRQPNYIGTMIQMGMGVLGWTAMRMIHSSTEWEYEKTWGDFSACWDLWVGVSEWLNGAMQEPGTHVCYVGGRNLEPWMAVSEVLCVCRSKHYQFRDGDKIIFIVDLFHSFTWSFLALIQDTGWLSSPFRYTFIWDWRTENYRMD